MVSEWTMTNDGTCNKLFTVKEEYDYRTESGRQTKYNLLKHQILKTQCSIKYTFFLPTAIIYV